MSFMLQICKNICMLLHTVKSKSTNLSKMGKSSMVPCKGVKLKPMCAYDYTVLYGIVHNACMERKIITYSI